MSEDRPPTLFELVDALDAAKEAVDDADAVRTALADELRAADRIYIAAIDAYYVAIQRYRQHRTQAGIGAEQP